MKSTLACLATAAVLLSGCGGSNGSDVSGAGDVVALAKKAGIECEGEWRQADNDAVTGLLGADSVYRCGTFSSDPNDAGEEYAVAAVFPDNKSRDSIASNMVSAEGSGWPVFVGDRWLLNAADASKMSDVAEGQTRGN